LTAKVANLCKYRAVNQSIRGRYLCGGWSWLVFSSFIFTLKPFVPNKIYTSLFVPNVELHVHEMVDYRV